MRRDSERRGGGRAQAMIEVLLCSVVTILPDFLVSPFRAGKAARTRDHALFGLVRAALRHNRLPGADDLLLTLILYFHPSTSSAVSFFRTVPILPEGSGRVEEVYVEPPAQGESRRPIFKLDSSEQEAALADSAAASAGDRRGVRTGEDGTGRRRRPDPGGAKRLPAGGRRTRDQDRAAEGATPATVAQREIEKLQNVVNGRQASVAAAHCQQAVGRRRRFRRCCRRRRPAPRPRSPRRRSNWTRRWCAPASTGGSNSSRCARATSSTRSCARPAC